MAMIHVNRGASSLGAFSEDQVREGIRAGRFLGSDLGWKEGMANWQPLSQFAEFSSDFATSTPTPGAPPPQAPAGVPAPTAAQQPQGPTSSTPRSGLPWERRDTLG